MGHILTYADIANKNNAGEHNYLRGRFEIMQLQVLEYYLLLWEIQHFGLEFTAVLKPRVRSIKGRKTETSLVRAIKGRKTETSVIFNTAHKRTRSGTHIGAKT